LSVQAAAAANVEEAVRDYAAIYEAFYRSLSTFGTFGKGWMNRLNEVLKFAASWLAPAPMPAMAEILAPSFNPAELPMVTGDQLMSAREPAQEMTFIDKVLGGEVMKGKKTITAAAVSAIAAPPACPTR